MDNAIGLFLALPIWYFLAIFAGFSGGVLSLVPAIGTVALAVGVVGAVAQRRPALAIFLVLPAASHALVVIAGFMAGTLHNPELILWTFLLLQMVATGYLVFRQKGARLLASALGVFALSYAVFASWVAGMAFTDLWL